MTTASVHPAVESIIPTVHLIKGYYRNMLDGVTPETFAQRPDGVLTNHPAYIFGHVAFYSNKIMNAFGAGDDLFSDEHEAVYQMNVECSDAADGATYLSMDESQRVFETVMDQVIERLPKVEASALDAPPTGSSFEGLMPTMGGVANFVLVAHPMAHAGQFSAWRRCMGLGPAALR